MASTTNNRLCSGTLTTAAATLYTALATTANYTIVKSMIICNAVSSDITCSIKFDGTSIINRTMSANDTIIIPHIDAILESSETISGDAGAASSIDYYISGIKYTG